MKEVISQTHLLWVVITHQSKPPFAQTFSDYTLCAFFTFCQIRWRPWYYGRNNFFWKNALFVISSVIFSVFVFDVIIFLIIPSVLSFVLQFGQHVCTPTHPQAHTRSHTHMHKQTDTLSGIDIVFAASSASLSSKLTTKDSWGEKTAPYFNWSNCLRQCMKLNSVSLVWNKFSLF